jgi:hypothetical protein
MPVNVNYGDFGPIMNASIKTQLRNRQHYLAANNAYPTLAEHPVNGNFEQQCAKKRFNDLVDKYRHAIGSENTPPRITMMTIMQSITMHLMMSVAESCQIEAPHRKQLEDLAVDIVRKDFNIKEGDVIFDVHIVGFGNVSFPPDLKKEKEEFEAPPTLHYDANDEVQKRRFINSLISGASKKGHYIFHLGKDELDAINPELIPVYQLLMSSNDLMYYMIPDSYAGTAMDDDQTKAGFEKLKFNADGIPVITVEAINFPALLHEIIKAIMELIATLALPNDKRLLEYVYDEADFLLAEMWYLRLGPVYWERLLNCFPVAYLDVKSQILGKIFELPTNDFNAFMRSALSDYDTATAISQITTWGKQIKENVRSYNQAQS